MNYYSPSSVDLLYQGLLPGIKLVGGDKVLCSCIFAAQTPLLRTAGLRRSYFKSFVMMYGPLAR